MTDIEEIKLKECPFCKASGLSGGNLIVDIANNHLETCVHCNTCGGRGETVGFNLLGTGKSPLEVIGLLKKDAEIASESWNFRLTKL